MITGNIFLDIFIKKKHNWIFAFSILCLTSAILIYLLFRSNSIKFIQVAENTITPLKSIRGSLTLKSKLLNEHFLYNLPDGLFLLGYNCLFIWLWIPKKSILWIYSTYFILLIFEGFQFIKKIPGTFDIYDLLAYTLATIMSLIISFFIFNKKTNLGI